MTDTLIIRLIEIVNAEIRFFHQLLKLLQEEQEAIVADDIEHLEASIQAQQEVARQARELELERIGVVGELSLRLDVEPDNVTLSRLLDVIEDDHGAELARMRDIMRELNEKIRTTNENNAFLIRQSMRYTDRCLDILTGQPGNRGMYGQFGKALKNIHVRSLVNQRA